jgi:hypothetical protein
LLYVGFGVVLAPGAVEATKQAKDPVAFYKVGEVLDINGTANFACFADDAYPSGPLKLIELQENGRTIYLGRTQEHGWKQLKATGFVNAPERIMAQHADALEQVAARCNHSSLDPLTSVSAAEISYPFQIAAYNYTIAAAHQSSPGDDPEEDQGDDEKELHPASRSGTTDERFPNVYHLLKIVLNVRYDHVLKIQTKPEPKPVAIAANKDEPEPAPLEASAAMTGPAAKMKVLRTHVILENGGLMRCNGIISRRCKVLSKKAAEELLSQYPDKQTDNHCKSVDIITTRVTIGAQTIIIPVEYTDEVICYHPARKIIETTPTPSQAAAGPTP